MTLEQAARSLWKSIPQPRRAAPKAQQSWRQLKPGQWLRSRFNLEQGPTTILKGELWKVETTTDQGATLLHSSGVRLQWTEHQWEGNCFERAKKPKEAPSS